MEITLEKIELVKDRTGVSYKAAKAALENTDGSVIDAIIYLEENDDTCDTNGVTSEKKALIEKIKDVVKKGNVTKIQFKRDGNVVLNIPITAGAIGSVIFPLPAITAAVVALAAKCSVEIVKDNGEVLDLNEMSGGRMNKYRDKAMDVAVDLGGKAGDVFEDMKIKAEDAVESVKYKAAERKERIFAEEEEYDCSEGCAACGYDCEFRENDEVVVTDAEVVYADEADEAEVKAAEKAETEEANECGCACEEKEAEEAPEADAEEKAEAEDAEDAE